MKPRHLLSLFVMFVLLAATSTSVIAQNQPPASPDTALGTAFTYQGVLNDGGSPANGSYDFQFVLYNASAGGSQVGSIVLKEDVPVTSGYFTVQLDFGAGVFGSQARWLEVGVRPGASTGIFTTLSPRQPLTPVPTALYASNAGSLPWSGLAGVPAGLSQLAALSCTTGQIPKLGAGGWACAPDDNTTYAAGTGLSLDGTTFSMLAAYRLPQGCANGQIPKLSGGVWSCAADNNTTYSPGTGLALNGTTFSLADAFSLPQNCVDDQILLYNGSAWVCGNGVVTNGSYADPSWLTSLSASKITGVLPVANGGTGSNAQNFVDLSSNQTVNGVKTFSTAPTFNTGNAKSRAAPFTVSSSSNLVVNNLNADLLDGQNASAFQTRVSGTCAVGSTIQAINADGSVVCQADAPLNRAAVPQANTLTTLDSVGDVGKYTSITIGADGLPVISYYDLTNLDLKVAHCNNAACTSSTLATPDSTGDVGTWNSITIGADGLPVISYFDYTNKALKVAHCDNAACTSSTLATLDSAGYVGYYTSITIGADGLPVISYYYINGYGLKVAHCANAACTSSTLATLEIIGFYGGYTSITIGADGLPVISYYNGYSLGYLEVAHCDNAACTSATLATLDSDVDIRPTSITIGADGLPVISYYDVINGDLKVAHCDNVACTSSTLATLDSIGEVGYYMSITIGADGLPVISYYDVTNGDLKVAHCDNAACTSATLATLDSAGDVGVYTSITIGADGLPVISYYDETNGDLKVAHCANAFCTPYFRRR